MARIINSPTSIRFATGAAALGVAATVTALAAPQAAATVTALEVAPGLSLGSHKYGTGCSYTVTARVDDNTKTVYFFEQGQGPSGFADAKPSNGVATATWTPSSTKITYIYALQPGATTVVSAAVDVGTGINLGSACVAN
ncbi:hypothetical protein NDR87_35630 [Nocardia sp. CDC159]|uniref:Ig-like domain-containing protein n=1 Tax=Nocardia pulmonis TaxID=2951408 RepID=A0A9X2EEF1_9NOCA|nr:MULTISPECIES: hypothetical protein [Nocardia]MCM6778820.1 hypothetical protein [Nocardia pulmonis]MCM6791709.1 hypothetical protein [Nocardia sp. CDC159]